MWLIDGKFVYLPITIYAIKSCLLIEAVLQRGHNSSKEVMIFDFFRTLMIKHLVALEFESTS